MAKNGKLILLLGVLGAIPESAFGQGTTQYHAPRLTLPLSSANSLFTSVYQTASENLLGFLSGLFKTDGA